MWIDLMLMETFILDFGQVPTVRTAYDGSTGWRIQVLQQTFSSSNNSC